MYSYTVVDDERYIRIDGPAISTVQSSNFDTNNSTTKIKDISNHTTITGIDSENTIISLGDDATNKLELTTNNDSTTLSLTNSGTTYSVSSSTALSTIDYSHIVGVIYDSSMNMYINNTLIGSMQ